MADRDEYEAAHRAADTPAKRTWIAAEARRRGETIPELCGLIASTYLEPRSTDHGTANVTETGDFV